MGWKMEQVLVDGVAEDMANWRCTAPNVLGNFGRVVHIHNACQQCMNTRNVIYVFCSI